MICSWLLFTEQTVDWDP